MTKKKFKCPWCGRAVNLWPDVFAGDCPKCGRGSLLHELIDRGELRLECSYCGVAINSWVTVVGGECYKCSKSHGITDLMNKAKKELESKRPYTLYSVTCTKCKKKIEASEWGGAYHDIFPAAGLCSRCSVVCWSCAKMHLTSGVLEANEIRAWARGGNAIALDDGNGNIMAPCCPSCSNYLTPIYFIRSHESFSLIKIRDVNPQKKWWQFWK